MAILIIIINSSLSVAYRKLGSSSNFNHTGYLIRYRVDRHRISAPVIEDKDLFGKWIIQDGVRFLPGHTQRLYYFQCMKIKNGDAIVRTITDIAFIEIPCEGHTMHPFQVADHSDRFIRSQVNDVDSVLVRNKKPLVFIVDLEIVPLAITR